MIQIILVLFLLGAMGGTLGDFFHVVSQTDGYPSSTWVLPFTHQPFWVPLLFGSATVGIGLSHPWLNFKKKSPTQSAIGNLLFLLLYAASAFLPFKTGGWQDILMLAGTLILWLCLDPTWQGALLALATALIGTGVEIVLTHFQIFYYYPRVANFYGVPSWLPWLYTAASITLGNTGRMLFSLHHTKQPLGPIRWK